MDETAAKKGPELSRSELIEELPLACCNEQAAAEFLERKRWGDTPCCPHCGSTAVYQMTARDGSRNKRFMWRCRDCGKQYTVRAGTVLAESLMPLRKWCRAMWMAASGKNGVSALELSRALQVNYRTALFVMHRLRHAMAETSPNPPKREGTIEADEVYWGGKARHPRIVRGVVRRGFNPDKPKTPIFAVVQRGGKVRARVLPTVTAGNVREALLDTAGPSCRLVTDELKAYRRIGKPFAKHDRVNHTKREYVNKADPSIHTSTVEIFFSRVWRRLSGTHHAVSKEHLHRYVDHAAFLDNTRTMNDGERTLDLLRQTQVGK
jgi:transposase-like protein